MLRKNKDKNYKTETGSNTRNYKWFRTRNRFKCLILRKVLPHNMTNDPNLLLLFFKFKFIIRFGPHEVCAMFREVQAYKKFSISQE